MLLEVLKQAQFGQLLKRSLDVAEFSPSRCGVEDARGRSSPNSCPVVGLHVNDHVDAKLKRTNVPAQQMFRDAGTDWYVAFDQDRPRRSNNGNPVGRGVSFHSL